MSRKHRVHTMFLDDFESGSRMSLCGLDLSKVPISKTPRIDGMECGNCIRTKNFKNSVNEYDVLGE